MSSYMFVKYDEANALMDAQFDEKYKGKFALITSEKPHRLLGWHKSNINNPKAKFNNLFCVISREEAIAAGFKPLSEMGRFALVTERNGVYDAVHCWGWKQESLFEIAMNKNADSVNMAGLIDRHNNLQQQEDLTIPVKRTNGIDAEQAKARRDLDLPV